MGMTSKLATSIHRENYQSRDYLAGLLVKDLISELAREHGEEDVMEAARVWLEKEKGR